MIEDLQKALDKFPFQSKECPDQIARYWCEQCQQKQHCDWLKEFKMLLVKVFREKVIAEEKNVEYAKLVAGQAQEYTEKNASLQQKNVIVSRKQLSDKLKEYKKIEKTTSSEFWREGARWVIEFIEKELLDEGKTGEGK